MFETSDQPTELIPAATVLLIRDSDKGPEVLMLLRNRALKAFGGAWVFPGGRVDPGDGPDLPDLERARIAAIRETEEETGLDISGASIARLSTWIPPTVEIRRFSTEFFVAEAPNAAVTIDEGEIHDHRWVVPSELIQSIPRNDFRIMPPTYISLLALSGFESASKAITAIKSRKHELFETKFGKTDDGFVTCWEGDAGYEDLDFDRPGPRRRLRAGAKKWQYQNDFI